MCLPFSLALLLARSAGAQAQGPRPLPVQQGLGSECGPLLSCPWSGPFAGSLTLGGQWWNPGRDDAHPRTGGYLLAALGFSGWRWGEAGLQFSLSLREPEHKGDVLDAIFYPVILWGRFTPQLADSFKVGVEVRGDFPINLFDGSGRVYADAQWYSLMLGHETRVTRVHLVATYQEAGARAYRGVQGGVGVSFLLAGAGFALHAEALGLVGGEDRASARFGWGATVGLRLWNDDGVGMVAGHTWAGTSSLPETGLGARFRVSVGPEYKVDRGYAERREAEETAWRHQAWRRLAGFGMWMAGYFDPIVGADGLIYTDDGKVHLAHFGRPDPQRPGYIIPDNGPGPVRVGENVNIRMEDGAVRSLDGFWLGTSLVLDPQRVIKEGLREHREQEEHDAEIQRAQACPWCRPAPVPDYADGQAGYAVGCLVVRWASCGIKPWDVEAQVAAGGLPPPGPGPGVRAATRRGQSAAAVRDRSIPRAPAAPRSAPAAPAPAPVSSTRAAGTPAAAAPAPPSRRQGASAPTRAAEPKGGTYELQKDGERCYAGHTCDLQRRERDHTHDPTKEGAKLKVDIRTDDYAERRGREQQLYDEIEREQRAPPRMNKQRPVSRRNKHADEYERAAQEALKREAAKDTGRGE